MSQTVDPDQKHRALLLTEPLVPIFSFLLALTLAVVQYFQSQEQSRQAAEQMRLAQQQTDMQAADQRTNSLSLLMEVVGRMADEVSEQKQASPARSAFRLSKGLIAQITSLSHGLRPYHLPEVPNAGALSPERGQLLLAFANFNLDTATMQQLKASGNFQRAYIGLYGFDIQEVIFGGISLPYAYLDSTNWLKGDFTRANLSGATFHRSRLDSTSFRQANLSGAALNSIDVRSCDFSGAQLLHLKPQQVSNLHLATLDSALVTIRSFREWNYFCHDTDPDPTVCLARDSLNTRYRIAPYTAPDGQQYYHTQTGDSLFRILPKQ